MIQKTSLSLLLLGSVLVHARKQHYIIGGDRAPPNEYPWFVQSPGGGCGGSLISSRFVLTAAHCAEAFKTSGKIIVGQFCYGSNNCGQDWEQFASDPSNVYEHPEYSEDTFSHDFALVKLRRKSNIEPVDIDMDGLSFDFPNNKEVWAAGFGATSISDTDDVIEYPDNLLHTELFYIQNTKCLYFWKEQYEDTVIDSSMMCAKKYKKSVCFGDSGGPLVDKVNNVLIGLTSWGSGTCQWDMPPVFARIADEVEWIRDTVCNNSSNDEKPDFCIPSPPPSSSPTEMFELDMSTYLTFISKSPKTEQQFCIQPQVLNINARIAIQECNGSDEQKWVVDEFGRLHWFSKPNLCITRILKDNTVLKLGNCMNTKSILRQFMYNDFESTIVWKKYGAKTFSIEDDILKDGQRVVLADRDMSLSSQEWEMLRLSAE